MPSLLEIGRVVLEKKMKMWKVYDKDNNDNDGQRTYFDQKSSLEPKAQVTQSSNLAVYTVMFTVHFPDSLACCQFQILSREIILVIFKALFLAFDFYSKFEYRQELICIELAVSSRI